MSKATTTLLIILITLLLYSSTLKTYAARPNPASPEVTTALTKPQHKDVEEAGAGQHGDVVGEEKCEEGMEEEECLKRRTLVAHLDYIYTQSKNP